MRNVLVALSPTLLVFVEPTISWWMFAFLYVFVLTNVLRTNTANAIHRQQSHAQPPADLKLSPGNDDCPRTDHFPVIEVRWVA